jgi:hypothetical protein
MKKILSLADLIQARQQKKAVVCPTSRSFLKYMPAAFVSHFSGEIIHRLISDGLWIYSGKQQKKTSNKLKLFP